MILTRECVELQGKNAECTRVASILRKENEELKERYQVLIKELANSQSDYKALLSREKKKLEEEQKRSKEKDKQLDKLINEIEEFKKQNLLLKKEKELLNTKYEDVQKDLKKSSDSNTELQNKNRTLTEMCEQLKVEAKSKLNSSQLHDKSQIPVENDIDQRSIISELDRSECKFIIREETIRDEKSVNLSKNSIVFDDEFDYSQISQQNPQLKQSVNYSKNIEESFPVYEQNVSMSSNHFMSPEKNYIKHDIEADSELGEQSINDSYCNESQNQSFSMMSYATQRSNLNLFPGVDPKLTTSVIMESIDNDTDEEVKSIKSYYGTGGIVRAKGQVKKIAKTEHEKKYRDCLLTNKSRWYEDRCIEIGIIRNMNQSNKTAEYKLYFGNKKADSQLYITAFNLMEYETSGILQIYYRFIDYCK